MILRRYIPDKATFFERSEEGAMCFFELGGAMIIDYWQSDHDTSCVSSASPPQWALADVAQG